MVLWGFKDTSSPILPQLHIGSLSAILVNFFSASDDLSFISGPLKFHFAFFLDGLSRACGSQLPLCVLTPASLSPSCFWLTSLLGSSRSNSPSLPPPDLSPLLSPSPGYYHHHGPSLPSVNSMVTLYPFISLLPMSKLVTSIGYRFCFLNNS